MFFIKFEQIIFIHQPFNSMFRKYLITILATLIIFNVYSQQCGTVVPKSYIANPPIIQNQNKDQVKYDLNKTLSVKIYRVANDYNSYDITYESITPYWDTLNQVFAEIGLQFEICLQEDIPNYNYSDLDAPDDSHFEEKEMVAQHYTDNVINVYYVNNIVSYPLIDPGIAGYAYMPGGPDIIVLTKGSSSKTLIHEMGHFFGLFHTFDFGFGQELVNGSNCETTGDLVCDTPADINGEVNNDCKYIDHQKDGNGDYYTPYLSNYMSYYPKKCTCRFTIGQYNRMAWIFLNERNYLW